MALAVGAKGAPPLVDVRLTIGCDVCGALGRQRAEAWARGDMAGVADATAELGQHPHNGPVGPVEMTTRTIIRAVLWTLRQDGEKGAPQAPRYQSECTTCGERSDTEEGTRVGPEVWALTHVGRHPSHRAFRATAMTFWRAYPSAGSDVADPPVSRRPIGATP
ncbi:hypothetical protein [Streptomyces sp. NPDC088725]|uniref:DUF7848 domain-containing protein n=1 Tax=Streptomyces sp. NPDC088725 TaxID=3365873 RepID=UPI0038119440